MIKLDKTAENHFEKRDDSNVWHVQANLLADTSTEITAMGNVCDGVEDLEDGTILTLGSTCFTANKELGVLNSTGTWNF